MTKSRYPQGCATGSQVRVEASSPSDYAFGVNLKNGNVNWNDQNNNGLCRPVRRVSARECQGAVQVNLHDLYKAERATSRGKKSSQSKTDFRVHRLDRLIDLRDRMNAGTWEPSGTVCFIADRPKAREIHAPIYADRVEHHWLIPKLEALFEPAFTEDAYAGREGKGTHKAVEKVAKHIRQVESGQGGAWVLTCDVKNFFNSLNRATAWRFLKERLIRAGASDLILRQTHALLRQSPIKQGVRYRATVAERELVPPHKRLENARPGCGLPIGALPSQFIAAVYMDKLDQFIKHVLKVERYTRYVDDIVLVHRDREQLAAWLKQIEAFLDAELHLQLKDGTELKRASEGVDFLGYVIYPTHTLVRPRVIQHARESLFGWQQRHVHGRTITATPNQLRAITSTWHSSLGHFKHADSHRLVQDFHRRYPWLHAATGVKRRFSFQTADTPITIPFGAPRA